MFNRSEGARISAEFRAIRNTQYTPEGGEFLALASIMTIMKTIINSGASQTDGDKVFDAVCDAKSPNAVSIALRTRVSPKIARKLIA
jgi:hypothetical protein